LWDPVELVAWYEREWVGVLKENILLFFVGFFAEKTREFF
jgi:hypothetical protein